MRNQAGVALVSVLLIVAITTVMTVTMIQEQSASIQITRGYLTRSQSAQYALGGEELARQILYEDFALGFGRDFIGEAWSDPELHFEFDQGEVNLRIIDLQGLINLNQVDGSGTKQQIARLWLGNLVTSQGIDAGVLERLQDWLDEDVGSRAAGAEDYDYLIYEPPYRAGNGPMAHKSELGLTGITGEQYRLIEPLLTALPTTSSELNINSAPPIVLQSLSSRLTLDVAESIAMVREEQGGFETVKEFLQLPQLAGLGVSADGLGVQSSFFEARIIARYQDRYSYLTSLIHRDTTSGEQSVLSRNFMRNLHPQELGRKTDG